MCVCVCWEQPCIYVCCLSVSGKKALAFPSSTDITGGSVWVCEYNTSSISLSLSLWHVSGFPRAHHTYIHGQKRVYTVREWERGPRRLRAQFLPKFVCAPRVYVRGGLYPSASVYVYIYTYIDIYTCSCHGCACAEAHKCECAQVYRRLRHQCLLATRIYNLGATPALENAVSVIYPGKFDILSAASLSILYSTHTCLSPPLPPLCPHPQLHHRQFINMSINAFMFTPVGVSLGGKLDYIPGAPSPPLYYIYTIHCCALKTKDTPLWI